jgi:hypothetical protein
VRNVTYLFAFTHKGAEDPFISALERGIIKSEDIGGDDNEHSTRKYDYDALRRTVGGIEIKSHKA